MKIFRLALFTSGLLLILLGIAMIIPAALEFHDSTPHAESFYVSSFLALFIGGILYYSQRGPFDHFDIKEGFLLTTLSWILLSVVGAIPLYMSDIGMDFADAVFESVSGITTTGSTVLSGLDSMSRGVLLWRSILQWIGGIGIVAFAIVILPFLKIGGMQLFQTESSERSDKFIPRSRHLVGQLVIVYLLLSALCTFFYYIFGMSGFDAINHAMTTLSTGGYSTHDKSFGYFDSTALQVTATIFMFFGGLPFVLFVKWLFHGRFEFFKDWQVRGFAAIIAIMGGIIVLNLFVRGILPLSKDIVTTLFNVISILTTTGYATVDYTIWGPFITILFFFMTYLGACAGSTAGGLKTMRLIVVLQGTKQRFNELIYPHGIFTARYQGVPLERKLMTTVMGFLALYVLLNVIMTIALMLCGLDFATAISGTATAIANVGPGIGDIIGPAGNFSSLSDTAKWILSAGMLLGRLEILTVLVIFTPHFWQK